MRPFAPQRRIQGPAINNGGGGGGYKVWVWNLLCPLQRGCTVADIGFEKRGGALTQNFQINGFWPEFYI